MNERAIKHIQTLSYTHDEKKYQHIDNRIYGRKCIHLTQANNNSGENPIHLLDFTLELEIRLFNGGKESKWS